MGIIGLGGIGAVSKRSKKDIDLIYKYTFKDYRSNTNGVKKVLYLDDKYGTVLSPIVELPDSTFKALLRQSKFRQNK